MNVKKIIKMSALTLTAIIILCCISIGVFAYKNNITSLEEAKVYAENIFYAEKNEVLNKLNNYEFNEIINEIKQIEGSENTDIDKLSYYHIALADKMKTASKKDITSAILNTELSAESRTTIIISAEANEIDLDYELLADAIDDDNYKDIRPLLIDIVAYSTPDNIDEIEKIVDNKSYGFSKAIRTLWEIKPTKTIAIADEIFADYSGEYDEVFRGAFAVKSYQTMLDPTAKNCAEYIALCDKVLSTPCEDIEGREIYIISWMEEIQSKEILIYFREKGFAEMMSGPYLSLTLAKILEEPASVENIDLFLYFYPYTTTHNVWEALNKHLSNNEDFYTNNQELKNKLEQIAIENYEIVSILSEPNEPREVK